MKPLPGVRSAAASLAAPAPVIELVSDPTPTKKKGRPSKAEKIKAMRAKASDAIQALLDSEPKKADIIEFFRNRIEELED
jgi:hypothetical protein